MISQIAADGQGLTRAQVSNLLAQACPAKEYHKKKILLIVPDGTRTAPVGLVFQTLFEQIAEVTKAFDVLIALCARRIGAVLITLNAADFKTILEFKNFKLVCW